MGVRSDALVEGVLITSAAVTTLFTVPSGQTWLWKSMRLINENGNASTFFVDANPGGTAVLVDQFGIAGGARVQEEFWMAFDELTVVRAALSGGGAIRTWVWGAKLLGSV